MADTSSDPLGPLVHALDHNAGLPTLEDLGGVDLLTTHRQTLLERAELPELVQLIIADDCDDPRSRPARHAFLLAAATTPNDPLVLESVVDTLIAHPDTIAGIGDELVDAWLDTSRNRHDLIGGIALEAGTRLVLAGIGSHYALLDRIKRLSRELDRLDDGYAGRAVRVAGATAEHYPAPEIPDLLHALLNHDDVAEDAAFELGMLRLRQALAASDVEQARSLLLRAREHLQDASADDSRADAIAFGAAIDAVLAYTTGTPVTTAVTRRLRDAVLEIRLNLLGMPPGWRTPRFGSLAAWQQLVLTLENAQTADDPGAWLHAGDVVRDLVAAYSAHRTLDLLASSEGNLLPTPDAARQNGLHALLAPTVEHVLLAREGGLAILDRWLQELLIAPNDTDPTTPTVREQARVLRDELLARGAPHAPKPDRPTATALAGLLGPQDAQHLNELLQPAPELRSRLETLYQDRLTREPVDEVPVIATTYRATQRRLHQQCPHGYVGEFAADIDLMLLYLLRFLNLRLSETQKFGRGDRKYLRQLAPGEERPKEHELGKDLRDFLCGQGLRVELETPNVGGGRVDVTWLPHNELITIELKRDWTDVSWDALANEYLGQALSYQVSTPPVNFFVVLDLTDKPDGLAALPACVEVRTLPGPAGDPRPRTSVMLRIQGNKRDPSSL